MLRGHVDGLMRKVGRTVELLRRSQSIAVTVVCHSCEGGLKAYLEEIGMLGLKKVNVGVGAVL